MAPNADEAYIIWKLWTTEPRTANLDKSESMDYPPRILDED